MITQEPKRRIRTVLKYIGVTLSVFILALFILSYRRQITYFISIDDISFSRHIGPTLDEGAIGLMDLLSDPTDSTITRENFWYHNRRPASDWCWWFEFKWNRNGWVFIPLWAPFLVVAIPTLALCYFDHQRMSRRGRRCCTKCGYDLRLLDQSKRCPECGSAKDETRYS